MSLNSKKLNGVKTQQKCGANKMSEPNLTQLPIAQSQLRKKFQER